MKTIIFSFATLLITYSSMSIANQQIAQKSGCLTCHTIDKPTFAPSFSDIAEKYSGNQAVFEHLVDSINMVAMESGVKWECKGMALIYLMKMQEQY